MHIPIVGGVANGTAHYGVDIVLPRVVYKAAKKGAKDGLISIAAKYGIQSNLYIPSVRLVYLRAKELGML